MLIWILVLPRERWVSLHGELDLVRFRGKFFFFRGKTFWGRVIKGRKSKCENWTKFVPQRTGRKSVVCPNKYLSDIPSTLCWNGGKENHFPEKPRQKKNLLLFPAVIVVWTANSIQSASSFLLSSVCREIVLSRVGKSTRGKKGRKTGNINPSHPAHISSRKFPKVKS